MASTYTMVAYGSQGSAVKQLQSELNKRGYQLDEDGVFGKKTKAAVRDYQKKNRLTMVDGIAGDETWGSLLSAPTAAEQQAAAAAAEEAARPEARVTESTARRLAELEKGYQPSEDVAAARAYRDSVAAMQPGEYDSGFEDQLQALYDQIEGREAFSYDPEEDEAYRRYARLYAAQGVAAMEDTMGQAASLTGGYGSSYAQAVGQQAYDRYLGELAALVPELRQAALAEYRQEGQALTDRYNMLNQQEKAGYDRWQDTVAQWQRALSEAQSSYEDVSAQDEKAYQAMLKHYADKAEQERKLSAAGAKIEDSGYEADAGKESLSSMAADSLQRAVGNYLNSGREDTARALLQQYAQRMTPAQRKRFEALFNSYGRTVGW
nr:MAG TPA: N acetylmuramidase [Caudoviricetes sp.]